MRFCRREEMAVSMARKRRRPRAYPRAGEGEEGLAGLLRRVLFLFSAGFDLGARPDRGKEGGGGIDLLRFGLLSGLVRGLVSGVVFVSTRINRGRRKGGEGKKKSISGVTVSSKLQNLA